MKKIYVYYYIVYNIKNLIKSIYKPCFKALSAIFYEHMIFRYII